MKIVLTGGGTAGHVIPNLALVDDLRKHFDEIVYIGSGKELEKKMIEPYNIDYYSIDTPKFIRKLTLKNFTIPIKLIKSIAQCKKLLQTIYPNVVFSKGGYVSLPVVIAAHKMGIKVVAHESDLTIGLANKICKRYCDKICTTFKETAKGEKFVYTGAPIRKEFKCTRTKPQFTNSLKSILFVGGSQGATEINNFVTSNLSTLTQRYNVIHLCGKGKANGLQNPRYKEIEFSNDMPQLINQCDVVFTRGGSNALFEILAIAKPMIIYPLSKKESRGDQIANAQYFQNHNLGVYIQKLEINHILKSIENSIQNKDKIEKKQKKFLKIGNDAIINTILSTIK